MALPVDRAQSHAMNLQVLKRQDEAVMDIVDMASHVVVYEFDQAQQSWKRKDVEGCLFVVKRYSSPRFQIFVNNRLSTTNMTIPVNTSLEVDSVDTFLILRSPDASAVGGFAIYGLWFFPEEDREKILKLLQRMVQTVKEPTTQPAPQKTLEPQPQEDEPQTQPAEQQPTQNKQPRQSRQRQKEGGQRGGRGRNKRENSGGDNSKPATPTAILQRPAKPANDSTASAPTSASSVVTQDAAAPPHSAPPGMAPTAGYTPISREEGIAAGNAILGMLGGMSVSSTPAGPVLAPPACVNAATTAAPAPQPRSRASSAQNGPASTQVAAVSKEQLKQTLIALLDEPQFFDQIYHAYVSRVHARS